MSQTRASAHHSAGVRRLFYSIDPQHLVEASLAVLFIECVDDRPHDVRSPIHLMKASAVLFQDRFVGPAIWFRADGLRACSAQISRTKRVTIEVLRREILTCVSNPSTVVAA